MELIAAGRALADEALDAQEVVDDQDDPPAMER
jgi:NTE family protein